MNGSSDPRLSALLSDSPELVIKQRKELAEILIDWETANRYVVLGANSQQVGYVAERKRGFLALLMRNFLRSHRPLEADIFAPDRTPLLHMARGFFWFLSSLEVKDDAGRLLGHVERRFSLLYKRYDLHDASGQVFARIQSPLWRLWEFPVLDADGNSVAVVSKKWGGVLKEIFSDADTFRLHFGVKEWTEAQRAVLLAAAISVDFDFFEDNTGRRRNVSVSSD